MLAPRLMMIALALTSTAAIWTTLGQTPAFNPRLVSESARGDGRLSISRLMYDRGTYEFHRGNGLLRARPTEIIALRAQDNKAADEIWRERAVTAYTALEDAVALDPGNAYAWTALGWARAQLGDREGALSALRSSYQIAPYNRSLAGRRLNLVEVLARQSADGSRLTKTDFEGVARDIDVLARYEPRLLRSILNTNSTAAAVDQARLRQ